MLFKDKVDIEKELFDEFNSNNSKDQEETFLETIPEEIVPERKIQEEPIKEDDGIAVIDREVVENDAYEDNKLPDISLDEYMKNFDENKVKNTPEIFDEEFPSIPM